MMAIWDLLRYVGGGLALMLAATCVACAVDSRGAQRGRFLVLLGYAVITVSGQLDNLGKPATWRLPALVVVTIGAVVWTVAYLLDVRRSAR